MSDYTLILTTAGQAKIAQAIALGTQINISQIAFGDASYQPSANQTALVHEVKRINISSKSIDSENKLVLESFLPASDYGYQIREMGIFDNTGTMIAVKKYPFIDKINPQTGALIDLYIKEYLVVSNSTVFNISIDPNISMASQNFVNEQIELYKYTHPETHPAPMITQDTTHRFVTDIEKDKWNNLILKGSGSPENVVTSTIIGQLYEDTANKNLYMKSTATGNTGWEDITGKQKRRIIQNNHGFDKDFIYCDSNFWKKAIATAPSTTATHFAVKVDNNTFDAYVIGDFDIITDSAGNALVSGEYYFLSNTVAGKVTKVKPAYDIAQAVLKTNNNYFSLDISEPQYIGRDIYNCPSIGSIFDWGLSTPPMGAVFAQGQLISAVEYVDFKNKIVASNDIDEFGITQTKLYQWGNAEHSLIRLPNLSGRVRIGAGGN
ncbi:MAG: phage tail protein [bacterium]